MRELAQQTNDEVPVGPFVHGLALGKSVVLLGSGVSNSNGQYAVVLPDVRDPAALVR